MSKMLQGKVVVVTGAGRGIGRDFALAMAANGASVVANDLGASVGGEGEDTGPAQEVVNNAGILRDRFFFNMSIDEWKAVIDVHLNGSFYVARAAAPHFKKQNSGCYINMTSTSGLVGNLGQANYAAAKLGIAGLSKSIAMDMAKFSVRSNCIAPFAWSQIFGVRANEIYLFSQNRPLRSVQRSEGWTPETIANHAMPALKAHFYSLDRSQDVFTWDPV